MVCYPRGAAKIRIRNERRVLFLTPDSCANEVRGYCSLEEGAATTRGQDRLARGAASDALRCGFGDQAFQKVQRHGTIIRGQSAAQKFSGSFSTDRRNIAKAERSLF